MPIVEYIVDIDTDTFAPMTLVPWEISDVSLLVQEYEASQGDVILVNGTPQALLFFRPGNEFMAYDLSSSNPAIVDVLIDSWDAPVLRGYSAFRPSKASVSGGGEDCLIGENKYFGDENPFSQPGSTTCLFRIALPIFTEP